MNRNVHDNFATGYDNAGRSAQSGCIVTGLDLKDNAIFLMLLRTDLESQGAILVFMHPSLIVPT